MSRLIDADALMELYADRLIAVAERYSPDSSECGILSGAMKLLEIQPTIEERKQGEWIYGERKRLTDLGYITEKYWKCSACGNAKGFRAIKPLDNFCLFCGADMRGKNHVTD